MLAYLLYCFFFSSSSFFFFWHRDNLPCALNLSSSNPAFLEGDGARGGSDSDDDDDYLGVGQYRLIT